MDDEWIQSILDNDQYHYLEGKTKTDLQKEVERVVPNHIDKLKEYRYVDEVPELVIGRHIRWVKKDSQKLTNGGILTDIKFLDNGIYLLCKMYKNTFYQYRLEDTYSFHKISPEEFVVLLANELNIRS